MRLIRECLSCMDAEYGDLALGAVFRRGMIVGAVLAIFGTVVGLWLWAP
jgi:hypothetical protein